MLVLFNALQAGNRSGTGAYTRQLARWLPEVAPDMDVRIVWPEDSPVPSESNTECFVLHKPMGSFRRIAFDQWGLASKAKSLHADLVHYPANVGRVLSTRNMVVTVHDLSFFRHPEWFDYAKARYYRIGVARSVRLAARVIAVSQATANDLVEILRTPEHKIDVTLEGPDEQSHPVSEEMRAQARVKYRLPERFFLYVGTLEPRKNLVRLIQAYSTIAAKCRLDLVLAGREGWKVGPILDEARRSPCRARIHLPGFVPDADLPAVMGAADVFVYPSLWEGFGIPVADAMACGVPVITSNISGLPEVAGDAAVLVDPQNVAAIAEAMWRLAEDGELRKTMARKGLAHIAGLSWKRTAEMTVETYRRVLRTDMKSKGDD